MRNVAGGATSRIAANAGQIARERGDDVVERLPAGRLRPPRGDHQIANPAPALLDVARPASNTWKNRCARPSLLTNVPSASAKVAGGQHHVGAGRGRRQHVIDDDQVRRRDRAAAHDVLAGRGGTDRSRGRPACPPFRDATGRRRPSSRVRRAARRRGCCTRARRARGVPDGRRRAAPTPTFAAASITASLPLLRPGDDERPLRFAQGAARSVQPALRQPASRGLAPGALGRCACATAKPSRARSSGAA